MSKGAVTKQAILREGVETAYRVGLGGLTIGVLATACGLSKSGLYAHFSSKTALQLAVLDRARADYAETVLIPALATPRGEPRVRAVFERWIRLGLERQAGGCLFVKASVELDEQPGPVRDQLVRDHRDLDEAIAQIFRTGISEGQFRSDADPDQFAVDLMGTMLAFYHYHRLLDDGAAEARARRSFEHLLDAVRA
ncbi:TetR/AcrR family transcriptional regulator [Occultella glacieicola]|uniref:TetR/AcrR family transcriptional regulator n=1 Tax=Occultella glacieicola TaxID=2518684 RepID=A0ABY2E7C4_9MICO|nr:TetR/AcrR family transcriptional regulator [Occultella glacieicola]TDE97461.1 TetR/AcrR family transcriptional regulator [Occultella glacieicola]